MKKRVITSGPGLSANSEYTENVPVSSALFTKSKNYTTITPGKSKFKIDRL